MKPTILLLAVLLAAPTYASKILELQGQVLDAHTGAPLDATIRFQTLPENDDVGRFAPAENGKFSLQLTTGHEYAIEVDAPGYHRHQERMRAESAGVLMKRYELRQSAAALATEAYLATPSGIAFIRFGSDEHRVPEEHYSDLDEAVGRLKADKDLRVILTGHSSGGSPTYSRQIAEQRADAVRKYLRKRGVNGSHVRTETVAKGRTLVISNDSTVLGLNRRVEVHLVDKKDFEYRAINPFFRWRVETGLCSRELYKEGRRQTFVSANERPPKKQVIMVDPDVDTRTNSINTY
ncbi:MAG: OmpA family protein [Catalinimonas sp.]